MPNNVKNETFWITNISNRDVTLSDLRVTIRAFTSVNLLDKKHHSLTKEQVLLSVNSGSIFKRNKIIYVRKVPPYAEDLIKKYAKDLERDQPINFPSKCRSTIMAEDITYDELTVDDDTYAEENADMAEIDYSGRFYKKAGG
jgi:hypothetical protein